MATRVDRREGAAEAVAGYLAAIAMFVAAIAVVYRPVRMAPAAIIVALIAVGIGGRHQRLAAFALTAAGVAFVAGMVVAVLGARPLF